MRLTASVVTYRTDPAELTAVLTLLQASDIDRIWVVDNAAQPPLAAITARFPKAHYIPHPNTGYGAAHNTAIRRALAAASDIHFVLNTDIAFSPDDIARIARYMAVRPDVALVHPRIVDTAGRDLWTIRLLPTPFDLIIRRFLPPSWFRARRDRYLLKHLDHAAEWNVPYVQGSFMALRTSALAAEGLFDERFFMYPEDIDLTRRLHARWRTMYLPEVRVVHAHRAASYTSLSMLRTHIVNIIRYFNKYGWLNDPDRTAANRPLLP